ncbi:MAG: hypothetical protein HGA44_04970 [Cellulomonadaceae bacterium]|nr:hypothetical protein [Cellulomonadaceae bacterium]
MTAVRTIRVLVIEDNVDMAESARREIDDSFATDIDLEVRVEIENDFTSGYQRVNAGSYDIVVLDLRRDGGEDQAEDAHAGRRTFGHIKEARFVPVIFWTALPEHIIDEDLPPFVTVLKKSDIEKIPGLIRGAIESKAVDVMREVEGDVDEVLRKHMWNELAPHWDEYMQGGGAAGVAHVLIARLARTLEADQTQAFTSHPNHRYLYPPATDMRAPGDVLHENDESTWWVILTPACDFVPRKGGAANAARVVLARAGLLDEIEKFRLWSESPADGNRWDSLRQNILMATQNRFYYLPAFRRIPDLVVDLQHLRSITFGELARFEAVASLATPYAEALLVQHSHYAGRIGIPDLDSDLVRTRLLARLASDSQVPSAGSEEDRVAPTAPTN